ncbi:MAG: phosphodiester glycosidase family protein [Gemmatimonadota bacterium]|jgi:hypothetical protein|nr:phosphodiester glycosidase family protein [Gemmatimonadota bacterium]MDP6802040.1 phosphodiester glycosidase family protein [Gemmatimonadota bacterium]MDP7031388.1 phosphodiester glycosidase family protein [Gemmatimonadota bacterium]
MSLCSPTSLRAMAAGGFACGHLRASLRTALILTLCFTAAATAASPWTPLAEGLDLARFPTGGDNTTVTVLRADPALWTPDLLCASELTDGARKTARDWCADHDLVAAINAGMFATDYSTHVGYCRVGSHTNSSHVNDYQSAVAFDPVRPGESPFHIFDLDVPGVSLSRIREDYRCVAQNLRLIKRPGENRWSPQPRRWTEAALGEDSSGRMLFIFCEEALSMHDLNELLLSLPVDLVCAQHLEGGPEAQLFVRVGDTELELIGGFETGFYESTATLPATRIPFVIGLRRGQ